MDNLIDINVVKYRTYDHQGSLIDIYYFYMSGKGGESSPPLTLEMAKDAYPLDKYNWKRVDSYESRKKG